MLRKVVLGSIGVAALMPVVGAATPIKEAVSPTPPVKEDSTGPSKPPLMRPSDLPIYDAPHAAYAEYVQSQSQEKDPGYLKSALLTPIRAVREQVQVVLEHTSNVKHSVQDHYHDFQDRTHWIVSYLREEGNKEVRYGAVAMGGLTGFIFGLRGGIIRRVIYAGTGTTVMGLVCFPEDTKDILKNNSVLAKQYINIAYNFFYGDDNADEVERLSGGRTAHGPPDGKWLPWPMDVCNTRGVTLVLPTLKKPNALLKDNHSRELIPQPERAWDEVLCKPFLVAMYEDELPAYVQ